MKSHDIASNFTVQPAEELGLKIMVGPVIGGGKRFKIIKDGKLLSDLIITVSKEQARHIAKILQLT